MSDFEILDLVLEVFGIVLTAIVVGISIKNNRH